MATEIEELLVKLEADTKDFQAEMRAAVTSVKGSTDKMTKDIESLSKSSSGSGGAGGVTTAFATMAGFLGSAAVLGAIQAVGSAFSALGGILKDGIADANAEEQATVKLASALQNTGNYSRDAAEGFVSFASALEETTGFADDAVISTGALIANIAGLSGPELEEATTAAADLAAALGIDLATAGNLVAKAANGQTEALKRYGISVEEGATKTETLSNVLGTLNDRFGGTAEKLAGTFSGSITRAQNAFGNLAEELGKAIKDNPALLAVVNQLADVFGRLTKYVSDNKESLSLLVTTGIEVTIDAARKLLFVIDTLQRVFLIGPTLFKQFGDAAIDTFTAIQQAAEGNFSGAIDTLKGTVIEGTKDMADHLFGDNILTKIDEELAATQTSVQESFGKTTEVLDKFNESQNNAAMTVATLTEEMRKQGEQGEELAMKLVESAKLGGDEETANLAIKYEEQQALLDAALEQKRISEEEYAMASQELGRKTTEAQIEIERKKSESIRKEQERQLNDLKSTFSSIATLSNSSNKTLAAIGKAAAVAQATIDTYAAANKALASAPPPFNFALAAAVTAAGIANVAKIVGLQGGIDEVPGVGNRDNFPAVLAPGERVVPRETNKDLKEFLEGRGSANAGPQVVVTLQINEFFESDENNIKLVERIQKTLDQTGFRLRTAT